MPLYNCKYTVCCTYNRILSCKGAKDMPNFNKLIVLASKLASDNGVTIQELLRDDNLGYNSRSSIYQDFRNLDKSFGLYPISTNEYRGKSGREVVYRIEGKEWNEFKMAVDELLGEND